MKLKDWLEAADGNRAVHAGLIVLLFVGVLVVHHSSLTMEQFWNANLIACLWNLLLLAVADLVFHRPHNDSKRRDTVNELRRRV